MPLVSVDLLVTKDLLEEMDVLVPLALLELTEEQDPLVSLVLVVSMVLLAPVVFKEGLVPLASLDLLDAQDLLVQLVVRVILEPLVHRVYEVLTDPKVQLVCKDLAALVPVVKLELLDA